MWIGDEWFSEPGMTPEQQRQCFELRMALSAAGYNWRAVYPGGEVARFHTVSESGIKLLGSDYSGATLTAIVEPDGQQTIVDRCPLTAAERIAAEEAARRAQEAAEEAMKAAQVEAARAKERARKEAKRRALGKPTRAEWLAQHSAKPWIPLNMSRSVYYRARKRDGMGAGNGGG